MENVTGGRLVAYAEIMDAASKVMAHRFPHVPNLGDVTRIDWDAVREEFTPTIISAGFPCQGISNAGRRKGLADERSGIWRNVCEGVGVVRPRYVFLENVAAIRSRGLDQVVQDLAAIGYGIRWTCIRASDVGAPHVRDRWFAVARPE